MTEWKLSRAPRIPAYNIFQESGERIYSRPRGEKPLFPNPLPIQLSATPLPISTFISTFFVINPTFLYCHLCIIGVASSISKALPFLGNCKLTSSDYLSEHIKKPNCSPVQGGNIEPPPTPTHQRHT